MTNELEFLTLTELREKLNKKEISSTELTKYFLTRIKNLNPEFNAYVTVTEEEALKNASEADDFISSPGENPFCAAYLTRPKICFVPKVSGPRLPVKF
jgi:aspartyl-tRNA(Asn)/glutamyl-tRNA(Gln) amidotransferase subunit A